MRWWEFSLQVPPQDAQDVADAILPLAYGGVAIEPAVQSDPGSEEVHLPAHLPSTVRAYLLIDRAFGLKRHHLLRRARRASARLEAAERELDEADWAESWRAHVKTHRVGRLVIRPPWARTAAGPGQLVVEIEPGMAFGTGDHPTTLACLRALERRLQPGQRVLDLGTGSGILAIAAAKLGAPAVFALDTDPVAVQVATANCVRNGVAREVTVVQGGLDAPEARGWHPDLLLANLTSRLHGDLAKDITAIIPPAGTLIAAGIGQTGLSDVLEAYHAAGAQGLRVGRQGPWRTLQWTKPGSVGPVSGLDDGGRTAGIPRQNPD